MHFVRFAHEGHLRYGRLDGERVVPLDRAPWDGGVATGEPIERAQVRLLAPCSPSKIVCVGRNYALHAKEMGMTIPEVPLLFLKPPSAVIGPDEAIELPSQSQRVEHEGELGAVIGRTMKHVTEADALSHVFGYTCVNDVTARDLQRADVQFTRGKGFDTFCPIGPVVATGLDPGRLRITVQVGGTRRQDGNTRDMIFPVARLLAFASSVMTLLPGDIVVTGTPEGVGPLVDGDVVTVAIEGIGELHNPVRVGR